MDLCCIGNCGLKMAALQTIERSSQWRDIDSLESGGGGGGDTGHVTGDSSKVSEER